MPKKKLHNSHLEQLFRCGVKFERKYLKGDRESPSSSLFIGSGTHAMVSDSLRQRMDGGELFTPDEVKGAVEDYVDEKWTDDIDQGEGDKELAKKDVVETVEAYRAVANSLTPMKDLPGEQTGVEFKWVLAMEELPYELHGEIDLVVEDMLEKGYGIRDMKVRGKTPNKNEAARSQQLSMYSLAATVIMKTPPNFVAIDAIIRPGKRKGARVVTQMSERDDMDHDVILNRVGAAIATIEAGTFLPANTDDWWCTEKFCGFARDGSCPYFRGREVVSISTTSKENENGEEKRKEIDTGTADWDKLLTG